MVLPFFTLRGAIAIHTSALFVLVSLACRRTSPPSSGTINATPVSQPTLAEVGANAPAGARADQRYIAFVESAQKAAREGRYTDAISLFDQAAAFLHKESSGQQIEEFCDEYFGEVTRLLDRGPRADEVPALVAYLTTLDPKSCFQTSAGRDLPLFARIRKELWRFAPATDTMRRINAIGRYCTVFELTAARYPTAEELRTFQDPYEPSRFPSPERMQWLTRDAWGTPFMVIHHKDGLPRVISAGSDRTFQPEQWEVPGVDLPHDQDIVVDGESEKRFWKLEVRWRNI